MGGAKQVADLRERIQIDEWDTAAWEALVAAVSDAAERDPSPQQLEQQRLVFNDFLAKFPTAVSPPCCSKTCNTQSTSGTWDGGSRNALDAACLPVRSVQHAFYMHGSQRRTDSGRTSPFQGGLWEWQTGCGAEICMLWAETCMCIAAHPPPEVWSSAWGVGLLRLHGGGLLRLHGGGGA
jgi:hypothetical protein